MKIRRRIFEIIERAKPGDHTSLIFDYFILGLISANIIAVIIASFNGISESTVQLLKMFELFSVVIFSVEYLLRIWTADYLFPKSKLPRLRYVFTLLSIIDLCAVLPFYLPFIVKLDLRFLRMLRLFRLFRIFKLNRYNDAMDLITKVLKNEKEKLLTTISITTILILFSSSIMYYVENEAQPDKFPNIIASVWWSVATLTTVGYGDVYPITAFGKIISGVIAILGIGLVALPTGIISSGFINEVANKKSKVKRYCPHCGKEIE